MEETQARNVSQFEEVQNMFAQLLNQLPMKKAVPDGSDFTNLPDPKNKEKSRARLADNSKGRRQEQAWEEEEYSQSYDRRPNGGGFHRNRNPPEFLHKPRVEIPIFTGDNPRGWVRKCESYFKVCVVPAWQQVEIAVLYLSGEAEEWYLLLLPTSLALYYFVRDIRQVTIPHVDRLWAIDIKIDRHAVPSFSSQLYESSSELLNESNSNY
jgi:hypothetical protein